MLRPALKSTTMLATVLALATPQFGLAQDRFELTGMVGQPDLPRVDGTLQICVLDDPAPCLRLDGTVAETRKEANAAAKADSDLKGAKNAARQIRNDDRAAMAAGAEPAAEEEAPAEAAAPEAVPETAAPEEQAVAPEAPTVEEQAVAPEPMLEEPATEETATAEPEAPAQEETAAEGLLDSSAEAAGETLDKAIAEAQGGGAEAAPEPVGETVVATDDAGLTEESAEAEAEQQAQEQEEVATVAAAAAADEAEPADAGEVETVTLTDEDVRKSDTDVAADREARKKRAGTKKDGKGLSAAETAALVGLGVLVVDQVLKNGDRVVSNTGDRAVVSRDDGTIYVMKDDDAILRQPGAQISTRTFDDGSTITTVKRANGIEVRTVRDATGRVLRRVKVLEDGSSVVLFDDTAEFEAVDVSTLPRERPETIYLSQEDNEEDLRAALRRQMDYDLDRRFSLGQVRNIRAVRELVPIIDLDSVTFDTGSAAIRPSEADELVALGNAMNDLLYENPGEVFLIEGHTDAVGSAASNLTLSDRRAESLALALTEYFDIPPENMVVQGYGEAYLKVPTLTAERENRRVAVRRITPLLTADAS